MDLTVVAGFAVVVFVLSIAPGPDMMFIVANAVASGRLAGTLSDRLLHHGDLRRWLDRTAAGIFGGLAVRLVLDTR